MVPQRVDFSGKFAKLHAPIIHWGSLGFEHEVTFAGFALVAPGNLLAIYPKSYFSVFGLDVIMVPFAHSLGQALGGKASTALGFADLVFLPVFRLVGDLRGKGLHSANAYGEYVSMAGEPVGMLALVFEMIRLVTQVEDLHFYPLWQSTAWQFVEY